MRWPWQRSDGRTADASAQRPAHVDAPPPVPPAGWAFLPPLQRELSDAPPAVLRPAFVATLPTRVVPASIGSMGHLVDTDAPAGTVAIDGAEPGVPVQRVGAAELKLRSRPAAPSTGRHRQPEAATPVQRQAMTDAAEPAPTERDDASGVADASEGEPVEGLPTEAMESDVRAADVDPAVIAAPAEAPAAASVEATRAPEIVGRREVLGAGPPIIARPPVQRLPFDESPPSPPVAPTDASASGVPSSPPIEVPRSSTATPSRPVRRPGLGAPLPTRPVQRMESDAATPAHEEPILPSDESVIGPDERTSTPDEPMTAAGGPDPSTSAALAGDAPGAPPAESVTVPLALGRPVAEIRGSEVQRLVEPSDSATPHPLPLATASAEWSPTPAHPASRANIQRSVPLVAGRVIVPALAGPPIGAPPGPAAAGAAGGRVVVARAIAPSVPEPGNRTNAMSGPRMVAGSTLDGPDGPSGIVTRSDPPAVTRRDAEASGEASVARLTESDAFGASGPMAMPWSTVPNPTIERTASATASPRPPVSVARSVAVGDSMRSTPTAAHTLPPASGGRTASVQRFGLPSLPKPSLPSLPSIPKPPLDLPSRPSLPTSLPSVGDLSEVPGVSDLPSADELRSRAGDLASEAADAGRETLESIAAPAAAAASGIEGAAATAAAAATSAAGGGENVEQLVRKLYGPLVRQLKMELLLDRERRGIRIDGI